MIEGGNIAVLMEGVNKSFGGVRALKNVDLTVRRGEIHALLGENGAGKSTILKILRGVLTPDSGRITIGSTTHAGLTPQLGRQLGIGMIFQELSLVPSLSVAQNIYLAHEPVGRSGLIRDTEMEHMAAGVFRAMGVSIDPAALVENLSTGQQQLTEIAKALSLNAGILVLDEPTSALTTSEVDILFDLLRRMKADGKCILYVSHRMDEIFRIADHATVLRDGALVNSRPIGDYTLPALITDIMGKAVRDLSEFQTAARSRGAVALRLTGVRSANRPGAVDLTLHKGEVLGVAGLLGAGRSRLARMLFGLERIVEGTVELHSKPLTITSPQDAVRAGMALIPEDRRRQGLVLEHSVLSNIELPNLAQLSGRIFMNRSRARNATRDLIGRLAIRTADGEAAVNSLSGGNQQKVVIGKWLLADPDILILDEPTAGIDIGSKGEVLRLVRSLAEAGKSVLFISSELAELIAVSDRIAVMSEGRIVETIEKAGLLASGYDEILELKAEQRLQLIMQKGAIR